MKSATLQPISSPRKGEAARHAIRELALSLGSGNKLPTVREICKSLRISAVTAENVLSGLEQDEVIIRRHGSGIYVSPRLYQQNVALVFGRNAFNPGPATFCGMIVERSQQRAQSHNETFSFFIDTGHDSTDDSVPVHSDLASALAKGRIDGMLLVARHSKLQETWLRSQNVPLVSFDGGIKPPVGPSAVAFDMEATVTLAVKELVSRGCRRLALIGTSNASVEAFRSSLISHGLPADTAGVVTPFTDASPTSDRTQLGRQAMQLLAGAKPDGVIVLDDMLASGVVIELRERGFTIGQDVLLASHVNRAAPTLASVMDQIIALEVDPDEIVETMFKLLESQMGKNAPPAPGVLVQPRVTAGANVGRIAAKH